MVSNIFFFRSSLILLYHHVIIFYIELCNSDTNDLGKDDDISCHVMEGQLSLYFSDVNRTSYGTQLILQEVKSMMKDGQLDHCHPAIISVQFRYSNDDETNSDLKNGVLDESSSSSDAGNNNGMENVLNTMMSIKGMVIVGASIGMIPLALFLMQRYHRVKRSRYQEKDTNLEDTESSSGGGYSRPYSFLSSLFFDSSSDVSSDDSDIYSYSSSSTARRLSLQQFLRCLPPDLEFRPEDAEFQSQQRAIQIGDIDESLAIERKDGSTNIFDSTLVGTQDNKVRMIYYLMNITLISFICLNQALHLTFHWYPIFKRIKTFICNSQYYKIFPLLFETQKDH